ncbi:MAG: ABC transporter permease [Patescibacteria group bacterium]|jgi:putative ABC transport system permease protein
MNPLDLLEETYLALSANKARSALTILGIVIGIASVIAMVSLGQGAQQSIQTSIQASGSNLLIVMPGAQRGVGQQVSSGRGSAQSLTQGDADAIVAQIQNVNASAPEVSKRYQITAKGINTNTSVIGTTPSYTTVRNFEIDQGAFISSQDVKSNSKVAVLGPTTRDDLFGTDADAVGKTIKINSMEFKIIGVTKAKGGSGFSNPDDAIYIPISTAQRYMTGNQYVSTIYIQATNESVMTEVQNDLTSLLLERHKISDPTAADFSVMNQADLVATASSVLSTLTALLAAIAGISLVVGGIGIMNMMLTSVTERTREIGLRKAIGAHRREISYQFLAESVALTFIGGFIGIILGWLASLAISKLAGMATSISVSSILIACAVSAGIGIVFGYYPAMRAAKLNPIDALRHE